VSGGVAVGAAGARPLLRLESVRKRYGNVAVVDGVGLDISGRRRVVRRMG